MRKFGLIAAGISAFALSTPAHALSITFEAGGNSLGTAVIFQNFDSLAPGSTITTDTTILDADAGLTGIRPVGSTGNFASVQPATGSYTVNFGGVGQQVFSFLLGSLDVYNVLTLNFADSTVLTLNGQQIVAGPGATAGAVLPNTDGRVTFDAQGFAGITSATFSSTQFHPFEIDDLASAAPEPGTWGMMILGFGMAGAALRSRRRTGRVATA